MPMIPGGVNDARIHGPAGGPHRARDGPDGDLSLVRPSRSPIASRHSPARPGPRAAPRPDLALRRNRGAGARADGRSRAPCLPGGARQAPRATTRESGSSVGATVAAGVRRVLDRAEAPRSARRPGVVGCGPRRAARSHLASPTTGLGGRFDAVWVFTWASGGGTISGGRVLWKFRQRVPHWLPW